MLQDAGERGDLVFDDFVGLEGCNEILNDTRPDVVAGIHRAYFAAGADAVETNTFGANLPNLADYDIAGPDPRARREGRADRPARSPTRWSTPDRPRFVLGSVGPGRSCPRWATSRFAGCATPTPSAAAGCSPAACDAFVVETCQDLLQVKAAVLGLRQAMRAEGRRVPIVTHVTVETTGTMLLGSEIGAALTAHRAAGHRPHRAELRHRSGRDERAPAHAGQARPDPAVGDAERRAARAGPARRGVPAEPGRAGRGAGRRSSATTGCGWSAAAAARPRRTSAPSPTRSRPSTPARAPPASRSRA